MVSAFGRWLPKAEALRHLSDLPHAAYAGDVYAVRSIRAFTRQ